MHGPKPRRQTHLFLRRTVSGKEHQPMRSDSSNVRAPDSPTGLRDSPAAGHGTTLPHNLVRSAGSRPARTPQIEVDLMVECLQARYLQRRPWSLLHCYEYFLFRLLELWEEHPELRRTTPPSRSTFARVLRPHFSEAQIVAARFPRKRSTR